MNSTLDHDLAVKQIIWYLVNTAELKLTELLIKMFTDHQALTSLMKDKELSRC